MLEPPRTPVPVPLTTSAPPGDGEEGQSAPRSCELWDVEGWELSLFPFSAVKDLGSRKRGQQRGHLHLSLPGEKALAGLHAEVSAEPIPFWPHRAAPFSSSLQRGVKTKIPSDPPPQKERSHEIKVQHLLFPPVHENNPPVLEGGDGCDGGRNCLAELPPALIGVQMVMKR